MEVFIFMGLICAAICYAIAPDEHKVTGIFLGFFLGIVGVIVTAILAGRAEKNND